MYSNSVFSLEIQNNMLTSNLNDTVFYILFKWNLQKAYYFGQKYRLSKKKAEYSGKLFTSNDRYSHLFCNNDPDFDL